MTTQQMVQKIFCAGCVFLKGDKYCDCIVYNGSRFIARAARRFVRMEQAKRAKKFRKQLKKCATMIFKEPNLPPHFGEV